MDRQTDRPTGLHCKRPSCMPLVNVRGRLIRFGGASYALVVHNAARGLTTYHCGGAPCRLGCRKNATFLGFNPFMPRKRLRGPSWSISEKSFLGHPNVGPVN